MSAIRTNDNNQEVVSSGSSIASGRPTGIIPSMSSTIGRHNVSVTNIKCEDIDDNITAASTQNSSIVPVITTATTTLQSVGSYYNSACGLGVRIAVPKTEDVSDDDSETELTNIENLKVTRRTPSDLETPTNGHTQNGTSSNNSSNNNKNGPRPMSWEGELSEAETNETETDEIMDTDNVHSMNGRHTSAVEVTVIKSEATTTTQSNILPGNDVHLKDSTQKKLGIEISLPHEIHLQHSNSARLYSSPHTKLKLGPTQSDPINLKYEPDISASNSPLMVRQKSTNLPPLPANPSPDSAIHSVYTHSSPSQSPLTSRHAPYTPSLSRNNSDASHSSCYSYSSEFSPTHSPIQSRHAPPIGSSSLYGNYNGGTSLQHQHHTGVIYRPISADNTSNTTITEAHNLTIDSQVTSPINMTIGTDGLPSSPAGISRQQLINSPCPICGDKISGFHYGIFSCESCKGFFKRTVQNRKNYVCVRGGPCPVTISTRKKCPACRFDKCLQKGMKLEAIREDRTRGGRSTYQCSYTLPNSLLSPLLSPEQSQNTGIHYPSSQQQQQQPQTQQQQQQQQQQPQHSRIATPLSSNSSITSAHYTSGNGCTVDIVNGSLGNRSHTIKIEQSHDVSSVGSTITEVTPPDVHLDNIPLLLQEIMDVEHLWQYNEAELVRLNQPIPSNSSSSSSATENGSAQMTNPLLASAGLSNGENTNPDLIAHLCNVADHRLYKIVKWCKSLPLFKNISIDDQICLLINSWCELLLFSCCFRSVDTPGEIKMSQGKKISLSMAKSNGLHSCIERMLNLTDHLRRLRVDRYEYVAMKVIVLLQSDTSELREPVKVRECQEKALQSLQAYTLAHYPDTPSKFGELLLRIPDLQRTCQLGKEMLTIKSRDGGGDFNLLMELLRGEH